VDGHTSELGFGHIVSGQFKGANDVKRSKRKRKEKPEMKKKRKKKKAGGGGMGYGIWTAVKSQICCATRNAIGQNFQECCLSITVGNSAPIPAQNV
jgi:hypothetical protein